MVKGDPWEALKAMVDIANREQLKREIEAERQAAAAAWDAALTDTPPPDPGGDGPAIVLQANGYCVGCHPPRRACVPCLVRWERLRKETI